MSHQLVASRRYNNLRVGEGTATTRYRPSVPLRNDDRQHALKRKISHVQGPSHTAVTGGQPKHHHSSKRREISPSTASRSGHDPVGSHRLHESGKLPDPDVHRLNVAVPDHLKRVGNKLYIYRFNPMDLNTTKDGKRIAAIGASGSGKSRLALELSRVHAQTIPVWTIFNPSEPANHMYTPHVENESIIHDRENPKELIKGLYQVKHRQTKRCKDWWIPGSDPPQFDPDPSIGVILDDMGEDTKIFNDPIFAWLYCNSRNFKVWVIILLQYWYMLLKKFRRQVSHLFVFFMADHNDIKQLYTEYCSFFGSLEDFKRLFMLATKDRGTLVIDVAKQTANVQEKLFWYKHEMKQPPFKYGADWFNEVVRKRYDPEWEQKLESRDLADQQLHGLSSSGSKKKRTAQAISGASCDNNAACDTSKKRKRATKKSGNTAQQAYFDNDEELQIELI